MSQEKDSLFLNNDQHNDKNKTDATMEKWVLVYAAVFFSKSTDLVCGFISHGMMGSVRGVSQSGEGLGEKFCTPAQNSFIRSLVKKNKNEKITLLYIYIKLSV